MQGMSGYLLIPGHALHEKGLQKPKKAVSHWAAAQNKERR